MLKESGSFDGSDDSQVDDESSIGSSSDKSKNSDSSYSYSSGEDGIFSGVPRQLEGISNFVSSVRRRAVVGGGVSDFRPNSYRSNDNGRIEDINGKCDNKQRVKNRGIVASVFTNCIHFYRGRCPKFCNQRVATLVLVFSFVIWLNVLAFSRPVVEEVIMSPEDRYYAQAVKERMHEKLTREEMRKKTAEMRAARESGRNFFNSMAGGYRKAARQNKNEIPDGCHELDWQKLSFPNCNDIHEIDMNVFASFLLKSTDHRFQMLSNNETYADSRARPKYVGNGLWRDVFSLQPRVVPESSDLNDEKVVLKMMKSEHEVDLRNLDRHRRDALVMERLTSSPNVVNIYGFCANTVMTELVDQDLETLIESQSDETADNESMDGGPTRRTRLGRLELALEAAKGVAALHAFSGGPIIHADIQARQFLVDDQGRIKLNDFNRCRFRPKRNATGELCKIKIPSSPGLSRSPEEYEGNELDEKLDVYSLANIFFSILFGQKAWMIEGKRSAKKLIMDGKKPQMKHLEPGTSDSSLAVLMNMAYEVNPAERISAWDLVNELETLVNDERARTYGRN